MNRTLTDPIGRLRAEAATLADTAAGHLPAPVAAYPDWTVAELVVHTGRIGSWVTTLVADRATQRIPKPELDPLPEQRVIAWYEGVATALADTLEATAPGTAVWSFGDDHTAGFWRRRMVLETTIHRWDAQQAARVPATVDAEVAVAGVEEALRVYMAPRLAGVALGGDGRRVGLRCSDADGAWTVRIDPEGVAVDDGLVDPASVVVGSAQQLWLLLMGRATVADVAVEGTRDDAELLRSAATLVPRPRR